MEQLGCNHQRWRCTHQRRRRSEDTPRPPSRPPLAKPKGPGAAHKRVMPIAKRRRAATRQRPRHRDRVNATLHHHRPLGCKLQVSCISTRGVRTANRQQLRRYTATMTATNAAREGPHQSPPLPHQRAQRPRRCAQTPDAGRANHAHHAPPAAEAARSSTTNDGNSATVRRRQQCANDGMQLQMHDTCCACF